LLPGLGFDNRNFRNIEFGNTEIEYTYWIEPEAEEHIKKLCTDIIKKN
jgi:hypothetical protein